MRLAAPLLWSGLAAALLAGCNGTDKVTVGKSPPPAVGTFDDIIVRLTPPTPVNWDDMPGSDGFQVQVNVFRRDEPLPVLIDGTLEFVLYEGRVAAGRLDEIKPLYVWSFPPEELRGHLVRGVVGWGYAMRLPWGSQRPSTTSVTLAARIRPKKGEPRFSAPMHVAMDPN